MTTALDKAWDALLAHEAKLRDEFNARKQRRDAQWAEHIANLHTTPTPAPKSIGAIAPMSDYHESAARGWSTD